MEPLLRNLPLRKPRFLALLGAALAIVVACSSPGSGPVAGEPENRRPEPTETVTAPRPSPTLARPAPTAVPTSTPSATQDERALQPSPMSTPARPAPNAAPTPTPTAARDARVLPPSPAPTATPPPAPTATVDAVAPPTPEPTPTALAPSTATGDLDDAEDRFDGTPGPGDEFDPRGFVSGPACGDGPLLTALPIDLDGVVNINPLGNLQPPNHTFPTSHMYFGIQPDMGEVGDGPFGDGQIFPPNPVYAVAGGRLDSINVSEVTSSLSGREQTSVEYSFDLSVCEGLRVSYGHVGPVSDRIASALASLSPAFCENYSTGGMAVEFCKYRLGLDLAAGEQIGFNSGRAAALDVGAFDVTSQNVDFLHPELYGEEAVGSVCLLDLYAGDQRAAMLQLLGDGTDLRTADPICGVLNYTVPGTLQGNWFSQLGSFSQEDRNIAFVYDEVLPDVPVISIGFVPGIPSLAFRFEPRDEGRVNRLFADVGAGAGVFCYQDFQDNWGNPGPATHLLVEVPEAGQLLVRAEDGAECGPPQAEQIGADATQFLR